MSGFIFFLAGIGIGYVIARYKDWTTQREFGRIMREMKKKEEK